MIAPDVGHLGQNDVRRWAGQAGLIANASTDHDAAGWDFLLEWPHAPSPPAPPAGAPPAGASSLGGLVLALDRAPGPLQCLVQVKATNGRPRRWQVRLDHWRRLVRSPLPCFYLVVEYGGTAEAQRAFLVHVGAAHTAAVLRRIRELTARHGDPALHKRTFDLTWSAADALDPLDGPALRRRMELVVGGDLERYQREKLRTAATAGYERGCLEIRGRFRPPPGWRGDAADLLLDFRLGLVPHLEVKTAEVFDTRFDIPLPEPTQRWEGGVLGNGRRRAGGGRPRCAYAPRHSTAKCGSSSPHASSARTRPTMRPRTRPKPRPKPRRPADPPTGRRTARA